MTFLEREELKRFIPTCVGSAGTRRLEATADTVHPHVCGEREGVADAMDKLHGSSPRVWGALSKDLVRGNPSRFIPTCVGSAAPDGRPVAGYSVHPHVCGEREYLVWRRGELFRFIPTCVGSA